jgi:2-octaprenyl-6-methoxyphenol hydroxylase
METDILISGGGPAGSVLAVAAAQAGWRVTVVESGPPQAPVADDPRHIALSAASVRICSALGLWPALAPHAQAVQRVEVSQAGHFGTLKFSAGDLGLEALGQVLPAGPLFTTMQASARLQAGVDWQAPARIACASSSATHVEAQLEDGRRWQASLLVVAEGAQSALREALGFQAEAVAFGQTALLCTLQGGLPHGGASWQRLTADGPIAILPLRAAARAVVCTLPEAQAPGIAALDDAAFQRWLAGHCGARLGAPRAVSARRLWPLAQTLAVQQARPRVLLLGNSAHSLHPVAAQGLNLAMRDAAALAEWLSRLRAAPGSSADPGSAALLSAYAAQRARDQSRTTGFSSLLAQVLENPALDFPALRTLGLLALEHLPPLRRAVLRRLTGLAGRHSAAMLAGAESA